MRTAKDASTGEVRDAIDRGWWRFLSAALPDDVFLPVPNDPSTAGGFVDATRLEGLILTGGDDVGSCVERDATEGLLLEACMAKGLPVLGVCRGMQFLSVRHGATLSSCDPGLHRAVRHALRLDAEWTPKSVQGLEECNSYHNQQILLPPSSVLKPWAWATDGCLEAVVSRESRLMGIGWHPEREDAVRTQDLELFREHFHGGAS